MTWRSPILGIVATWTLVLAGCIPQQPVYFHEDGDLSHYLGKATEIDYPDAEEQSLDEVEGAIRPFSLEEKTPRKMWDLTLEDAVHFTLANNKVKRNVPGGVIGLPGQRGLNRPGSLSMGSETVAQSSDIAPSVYDPAIRETDPYYGVEAALSAFDTQFTTNVFWEKNHQPQNRPANPFFPAELHQDIGTFQARLAKTTAAGGTFSVTHNVAYEANNIQMRNYPSDWNVNLETEFRQPLLRGYGVQFNRIAGLNTVPGIYRGVMIARINTDIELADFEAAVRNLVLDVEKSYWLLYYAYRRLDAMIAGRDSALQTWRETYVKWQVGTASTYEEARARTQYFLFRSQVEGTLSELYAAESQLRYIMGLATTDGRLIRPKDEPTVAKVTFDWRETLSEALVRDVELRRQKWRVKQRELELIAAKNFLLPQVDAVGRYRWLGLGDQLVDSQGGTGNFLVPGSNAYQNMTTGNFQEWQLGFEVNIPIGFRKEHSGVRNAQLRLAKDRAILQEAELEISHQLANRIRNLEGLYVVSQTNFNRRIAAEAEVKAAITLKEHEHADWTLDDVLDAQRRLAEAEVEYYSTLVDYNTMIAEVHYRKGSLLEYNGIYLAEGPWPGKAYFDAHGRARARDAGYYIDYGFTRPKVISRGPYDQHAGQQPTDPVFDGEIELLGPDNMGIEEIPTPAPEPPGDEPNGPQASTGNGTGAGGLAKRPPTGKLEPDQGWSVKQASFEQAATPSGATRNNQSGTGNESVANPSVAETHRPASGWKGIQR